MTDFVLVHGEFLDRSAWDATRQFLEARGNRVETPTLAGHGADGKKDVTHADQVSDVLAALDLVGGQEVILVAHSYAGCVAQKVAEVAAGRIARIVMHAALVVRPGESAAEAQPPGLLDPAPDEPGHLPVPPFEEMAGAYFNDMPLADAHAFHARLTPSPIQPLHERLDTSAFFELGIPISVLVGTLDRAMPPGYGYHPYYSSRLGEFDLFELRGGHELLFSDPRRLAEGIERASRG